MQISATLVVICLLAFPAGALAQDTRAEEIAAKQREKAKDLKPYVPTWFEKTMTNLEAGFASPPSGFYPAFGSIYPGGGLAVGPGYRRFFGYENVWDVRALYSIRSYKLAEFNLKSPWNGSGRVNYTFTAGWLDAPQVAFYGLGPGETPGRANYHLSQAYALFGAGFVPTRITRLRAEIGYDDFTTKEGKGRHPSIEEIYGPSDAPGLGSDPAFIRTEWGAAIDTRRSAAYATSGGFYGLNLANYNGRSTDFGFNRLDGEAIQHIPLGRSVWVVSLRGRVQTILDDEDQVPYFLLPQLGSGSTLRGYSSGRFRDRHSLLTTAELRWIPNRIALDAALFYDAGKVTSDRSDLDFNDLKTNWGFGVRFHVPTATLLRIEVARSSEGTRLIFAAGAAF